MDHCCFFSMQFQVNRLKPTRLLSNIQALDCLGLVGPPEFDSAGWHIGPLPPTLSHGGHPSLIKKRQTDDFQTHWPQPFSQHGTSPALTKGKGWDLQAAVLDLHVVDVSLHMVHPFYSPP